MRIYKRGKTYWIDYTDSSGERVRESTKKTNKKEAEEILAKRKSDVTDGKFGIERPKAIAFKDLCERFFKSAINIKPSTLKRYRVSSNQLLPHFGEKYADKIAVYDIEKYRQERIKTKTVATINRDIAFMRRLFNVAKRWKLLTSNPIDDIDFLKEDNTRTNYYKADEVPRILYHCKPIPYLYLAVVIALNTGMRKGEIMSLQIPLNGDDRDKMNWVDMENHCFHLNITKSRKYRQVPMNDEVYQLLERELRGKGSGPVFKYKHLRNCFNTALKKAGVTGNFHDLRRTMISHAMMAGYSQEIIQRVVGQDDPSVFKRYAHLTPDLKKEVVGRMGRIFMEGESEHLENTENIFLAQKWHTEKFKSNNHKGLKD